jgi:hypothetical protein
MLGQIHIAAPDRIPVDIFDFLLQDGLIGNTFRMRAFLPELLFSIGFMGLLRAGQLLQQTRHPFFMQSVDDFPCRK